MTNRHEDIAGVEPRDVLHLGFNDDLLVAGP